MNPAHAGYDGAKNLNDAFQTRFYTIEIDYMDAKAEVQHILEKAGNHITEREARRLVDLAGNLRAMYPKEINTPISTRELIKVAKMKRRLSLVDSTKLIFGGIAEPTDKDAINKAIKTTLGKN
jgi:MoxR-like ATPase